MSLDLSIAWDRPSSSGDSEHWLLLAARGTVGAAGPLAHAILVDTSTSMVGERLRQATETVECIVRDLPAHDRVMVLGFGSEILQVAEVPGGSGVQGALQALSAAGKTRLDLALLEAGRWLENQPGRHHVLLLTDGDPTDAEGRRSALEPLLDNARALGRAGTRLTVIGLGSADRYDATFLRSLADAAAGVVVVGVHPAQLAERTLAASRQASTDSFDLEFELDSTELTLLEAWRVEPRVQPLVVSGSTGLLPAGESNAVLLRIRLAVGLGARRGQRQVGMLHVRPHGGTARSIPLSMNLVAPGSSERAVLDTEVDRLRVKVELARTAQLRAGADDWDDQVRLTRQLASLAVQVGDPRATRRIQLDLDRLDGGNVLRKDERETAVDAMRGGGSDG